MSLDAAEKVEDELRDKIDQMGNKIAEQCEQIEAMNNINFQVDNLEEICESRTFCLFEDIQKK